MAIDGSKKVRGEWSSSIRLSGKTLPARRQKEFTARESNLLTNGRERRREITHKR